MGKKPRSHHLLEWSIQEYTVAGGGGGKGGKEKKRTILRDVHGKAASGTFLAIMGPSGIKKEVMMVVVVVVVVVVAIVLVLVLVLVAAAVIGRLLPPLPLHPTMIYK